MRILTSSETKFVTGGCSEGCFDFPPEGEDPAVRNNNGYGNGAEAGPPPGHSGDHNPQLWTDNSGPRGAR
jgi:hypothetical protein